MPTKFNGAVNREVVVVKGEGQVEIIATLGEADFSLRLKGHRKSVSVSYADLLEKLPK